MFLNLSSRCSFAQIMGNYTNALKILSNHTNTLTMLTNCKKISKIMSKCITILEIMNNCKKTNEIMRNCTNTREMTFLLQPTPNLWKFIFQIRSKKAQKVTILRAVI